MFPSDKHFSVFGDPSFEDPTTRYPHFGKDLEAIVAKQQIKFGETGLFPPRMFPDYDNTHFEYRIHKGRTTSSEYEPILFDYFPNERTLRVHSAFPEFKICPIVDFIVEHYLKVHIREATSKKESAPKIRTYDNPVANEIINDPGCELFNDTCGMRLTGESIVSMCEEFSLAQLREKEFSEVSHKQELYPYWAMAEGAREIKGIWKLMPFYTGKTNLLPKRTILLSNYLDWNCKYSFWQAIDKFYRAAIQENIKYKDTDIMLIHYLGVVFGKSIKLINDPYGYWLEFDLKKLGDRLYAILERKTGKKESLGTLVIEQLDVIKKWVDRLHNELPVYETARLRGEKPKDDCFAKKVAAEIRKQPLDARLVDVAPSAGKPLRAAMKDPGGRPKKTTHGAEHYTQKAFAAMLNTACNCKSFTVNIIHDWEHGRSEIPFAWIDGERMTYSAEIRKFPSKGNNRAILEAIIKELKTGHWVAKSVLQKNTLHMKSPETLAKASGQVAAAIRDQSQLKYEK